MLLGGGGGGLCIAACPAEATCSHGYLWQNEASNFYHNTMLIFSETVSTNIIDQNFPRRQERWCWVGVGWGGLCMAACPAEATCSHGYLWQNEASNFHHNTTLIFSETVYNNIIEQNFPRRQGRWRGVQINPIHSIPIPQSEAKLSLWWLFTDFE